MLEADSSIPPMARTLDAKMRHVLISANPRAGARSAPARVGRIRQALDEAGYFVEVVTTLTELSDLAQRWETEGCLRAVLAAGGDGTSSAVRNHLSASVPLLPLPLGTESLLARYIRQSAEPEDVRATLEQGVIVQLDIGRAGDRLFLLMMSAGFDAEVVHQMQSRRQGNITRAAYVKPTLRTIRSYEYPEISVYCGDGDDDPRAPRRCRWFFSFNLPMYACGLQFTPEANATDGLLDVCMFGRCALWNGLRYLWHVARGRHGQLRDCQMVRGRHFRLEAEEGKPVAYQVDGDIGGTLPVDVEVIAGGLTLLVPPEGAQVLGFQLPDVARRRTAEGLAAT